MSDIFVQKITLLKLVDGAYKESGNFDLSFLKELTYVETLDLSGPRLMLRMHDPVSYLKDTLKVKEKDALQVSLSVSEWLSESLDQSINFVIATMPLQGQYIDFNCFEQRIWDIKQPHKDGKLFPKATGAKGVLSALFPKAKMVVDTFPNDVDYHVLPGTRPSKMLREMASEKGALLYLNRNKVYMQKISDLKKMLYRPQIKPDITYYNNESMQPYQIMKWERLNTKSVIKDATERAFVGWDMTKGVISGGSSQAPIEYTGQQTKQAMNNKVLIPMPSIDLIVIGNGKLAPGKIMGLEWQTDDPTKPFDESLPGKVLVGTVSHYYSSQAYYCRVKGITF